jgi:DNA-directed RNA polymerase specialized sigma24 family protein
MVCAMDEPELVAAIVAGDPTGLAEALDTYATPLFAYCRSILSQAEAAAVVEDTFVVARVKLDGLRDPSRLGQWLQAVARNECFRRIIASGGTPPAEPVTPVPDLELPDSLAGRVIMACTDDTPPGRARRVTITHRFGQFGHDGFPKPVTIAKQRRVPRVAVAIGAVVGAGVVAVVLIITMSGGSQPSQVVSALSSPTGVVGVSSPVGGTSTGAAVTPGARPGHSTKPRANLEATHSSAPTSPTLPAAATTAATAATGNPTPAPTKSAPKNPATTPTTTAPQPSPSPSTSTYSPPPNPTLIVNPVALSLVSINDAPISAAISILGYGTRVTWSAAVSSGGGKIAVSPTAGTLAPGASTSITVTVSGTASFTGHIVLMPGEHLVTVTVTAKKVVTKTGATRPYLLFKPSGSGILLA